MQTKKTMSKNDIQHNKQATLIRTQHVLRSGPIPSPEEMKNYSDVDSSLPDRIMTMAEEEQKHQYELRMSIIDKRDLISKRDFDYDIHVLKYCTFLCLLFMVLAAVLFYLDKTGAAVFFGVTAFITLPKMYLAPRANKNKQNNGRDKTESSDEKM